MGTSGKNYPKYIAPMPGGLDARSFGNVRAKGYSKLEWPKMEKNEAKATTAPPKKKKK